MDEQLQLFTLQIYTPNSDLAAGIRLSQVIAGRTGNDTLLGYQPVNFTPTQPQIDLFIGDITIEDPANRQWSDTFVLGDFQEAYYDNGVASVFGLNDFALLADFNPLQDVIQLNGTASDYQLLDIGIGSVLLKQQATGFDVISFALGSSNLSLTNSYFDFQGSTAPPPTQPQIQQLGTSGFDLSAATTTDPSGNVYIAGGTNGALEGTNPGPSRDAVIAKYDSQGNLLFTQQIGTADFDTISDIVTDAEGNFYVAGITAGNLEGQKQAESTDAFVAKYDSNGNLLWIEQFGQNIIFQAFAIDIDAQGNVYLSGIDVKSGGDLATDDFWVSKFDTNGNQLWFTEVGSANFDEAYDVTVGSDGSVYVTGWTLGDLEQPNAGLYDNYLARFDGTSGSLQWINQYGTSDYEWSWGVDTDSLGNIYTTGWTLGTLGEQNFGSYDAYLTKFDSLGNLLWVQQFGTAGDDEAFDIFIDDFDNIFLTGYTNSNLGGTNAGSFDPWAARYDTNGNQIWLQQFGTGEFDQAYGITSDNNGSLYVTGVTQGSLGDVNFGSVDAWVAKLNAATGSLANFNGNSTPLNANSSSLLASSSSNSSSTNPSSGNLSDQDIAYIRNFFEEFLVDSGIGVDGSGIRDLISDPYGQPNPPAPVPEPSAIASLLTLGVFCLTAALKSCLKPGKSLKL